MGAYRYCHSCNRGHDKPSAYDDLTEWMRRCSCGEKMDQDQTVEQWIIDIDERLTLIENFFKKKFGVEFAEE